MIGKKPVKSPGDLKKTCRHSDVRSSADAGGKNSQRSKIMIMIVRIVMLRIKVTVIPVIIGSLGTLLNNMEKTMCSVN